MGLRLTHIIFLLLINAGLNAQSSIDVQIDAWMNIRLASVNSGTDPGRNGAGISAGIKKPLKKQLYFSSAGELGAAGISNYGAVSAGVGRMFPIETEKFTVTAELKLLQGVGFFRPSPIYMWGISQDNYFAIKNHKDASFGLLLGFRFYGYPGYSTYSEINHFFDLKTGLRFSF